MGKKSREKKQRKIESSTNDNQIECDYLKSFSVWKRPPMRGPLWRREFFKGHALLIIGTLLAVLLINDTLSIFFRKNFLGIITTIMAIPFLLNAYVAICNGFSSRGRNRIYFRETEPVSYWGDILFCCAGTIFLAIGTWKV